MKPEGVLGKARRGSRESAEGDSKVKAWQPALRETLGALTTMDGLMPRSTGMCESGRRPKPNCLLWLFLAHPSVTARTL